MDYFMQGAETLMYESLWVSPYFTVFELQIANKYQF